MAREGVITVKNARIIFRNFQGKAQKYNPEGRRNFCLVLEDPQLIEDLKADGWNVKETNPRNEDQLPTIYIQVAVNYNNIPPKIHLISSKGETILTEEEVGMLDWAEIQNVDLTINPSHWKDDQGRDRVKAYLRTMYVTIWEDELEQLYSHRDEEPIPFD